jgi:hypothetical protein
LAISAPATRLKKKIGSRQQKPIFQSPTVMLPFPLLPF